MRPCLFPTFAFAEAWQKSGLVITTTLAGRRSSQFLPHLAWMEAPPVCRVALNMCAPPLDRDDQQRHCYFAAVLISENG